MNIVNSILKIISIILLIVVIWKFRQLDKLTREEEKRREMLRKRIKEHEKKHREQEARIKEKERLGLIKTVPFPRREAMTKTTRISDWETWKEICAESGEDPWRRMRLVEIWVGAILKRLYSWVRGRKGKGKWES